MVIETESLMTRLTLVEAAEVEGADSAAEDEEGCSGAAAVREVEVGRVVMTVVVSGSRRARRQMT